MREEGRDEERERMNEQERKKMSGFIVGSILIMRTVVLFRGSAKKRKKKCPIIWQFGSLATSVKKGKKKSTFKIETFTFILKFC